MDFELEHIGYLTDDIDRTARQFELLGYQLWLGRTR